MGHVRIWRLADSHEMESSDCDHLVVCKMPIHVIHMAHYRLYRLSTRERSHAISYRRFLFLSYFLSSSASRCRLQGADVATLILADPECRRLRLIANCPAANTSTFQDTIAIWT